jgi:DNA adenine methylase
MGTKKMKKAGVERQGFHIGGAFPYAGGKGTERALSCFAPVLLTGLPCETLAEPFAGSASISIFLSQFVTPKRLWLNDLNPSVYAVHLAVRDHIDKLVERVKELGEVTSDLERAKKLWYSLRQDLRADTLKLPETEDEIVELAAKKVYVQHLGWNQQGDAASGFSTKEFARWGSHVWLTLKRAHGIFTSIPDVEVTCLDYRDVLDALGPSDLAYVDPPYVERGKDFYKDDFGKEGQHEALRDLLRAASFRWVTCYGDAPEVGEMYGDWATIFRTNELITQHSGSTMKFERVITPPAYPQRLTIGDRTFDLDWPARPFETKGGWDFQRIHAFKHHLASEGIKRVIYVDGDDVIIDGRNRLVAAHCAGMERDDIPVRRLVDRSTTSGERRRFRLMLQGTHKGMEPLAMGEVVYSLQHDMGLTLKEIERRYGIPSSTASRNRLKYEKTLDGGEGGSEAGVEEPNDMVDVKLGAQFETRRWATASFDEVAAALGGKGIAEKAAQYLLIFYWKSMSNAERKQLSAGELDEVLIQKSLEFFDVELDDGLKLGLSTAALTASNTPPRWALKGLTRFVVETIEKIESEDAAAE